MMFRLGGLILLWGFTVNGSKMFKQILSASPDVKKCLQTVNDEHDFWSLVLIQEKPEIGELQLALKLPTYSLDLNPHKPAWFPRPAIMENRLLYVIYQAELESALSILRQTGWWNRRDKLLIFQDNLLIQQNLTQIFHQCYQSTQFKTLNVALVSLVGKTLQIQAVYLNNPFFQQLSNQSNCSDLFPNYFHDINGYNIPVSMKLSLMFRKSGNLHLGPEAKIAESVIKAMNGSVQYSEEMDKDYGYEDIPLTGILREVSTGRATASFNGRPLTFKLQELINKRLIESTYPSYQDNIVAVLPFDYAQSKFLKAYYSSVLIYIAISCFLAVALYLKVFVRSLPKEDICAIMLSLHMNQVVSHWTARSVKIKIVLMSLMVVCFFINVSWFSMLTKAVTVPVQPKIVKTVQQLVFAESCKLTVSRRLQKMLRDVLDGATFSALNKSRLDVMESDDAAFLFSQFDFCNAQGAIMEHLWARKLRLTLIRRKMKCFINLRENLVPAWATFPVTFGSPFLPQIDAILARMSQAGLHGVILRTFDYKVNPSRRGKWFYRSSYHNTPLSFFTTTFRMLLVGHTVAMGIFCLEFIYFKFKRVK